MISPEAQGYLDKARESIDAAQDLVRRGSCGFAASRAYYAMFYCAQALLLSRGLTYSSHGATIAAFGREFAKPRHLDPTLHLYIREAFDIRQVADYDPLRAITKETAAWFNQPRRLPRRRSAGPGVGARPAESEPCRNGRSHGRPCRGIPGGRRSLSEPAQGPLRGRNRWRGTRECNLMARQCGNWIRRRW